MNYLLPIFTTLSLLFPPALAQTSPPIVFPIAQLGNCESKTACKTYCDQATNQEACSAFALAHGLTKQDTLASQSAVLRKAASTLGCSDLPSCKALCSLSENFNKCSAFAKINGLPGGQKKLPNTQELLPVAKSLGLSAGTLQELRTDCSLVQNREACTQLARKLGLLGGLKNFPQTSRPSSGSGKLLPRTPLGTPFPEKLGSPVPSGTNSTFTRPPPSGTTFLEPTKLPLTQPLLSPSASPKIQTTQPQLGTVQGITTERPFLERMLEAVRSVFQR